MKINIAEEGLHDYKVLLDTDYYNDVPIGYIYKITKNADTNTVYFINLHSKISVQNLSNAKKSANDMINFLLTTILDVQNIPTVYWFGGIGFVAGSSVFRLEQIAPMNYFYKLTMNIGYETVDSLDKCEKIVNELLDIFKNRCGTLPRRTNL